MKNIYKPQIAKIVGIKKETENIKLLNLSFLKPKKIAFSHGQFLMIGIPGFGEAPFDICGSDNNKKTFEICFRKVGGLTSKLFDLKKGDQILIRGPYGNGFPKIKNMRKTLLLIGGGTGFITLRSIIKDIIDLKDSSRKIQVFYGAREEKDLLFKDEYKKWLPYLELNIILENTSVAKSREIGKITDLFDKVKIYENPEVIMCGPPIMYKFCLQKIEALKIAPENIWLSLERQMHCGAGVCQHCAVEDKYVCQDGPVFNLAEIKKMSEAV